MSTNELSIENSSIEFSFDMLCLKCEFNRISSAYLNEIKINRLLSSPLLALFSRFASGSKLLAVAIGCSKLEQHY